MTLFHPGGGLLPRGCWRRRYGPQLTPGVRMKFASKILTLQDVIVAIWPKADEISARSGFVSNLGYAIIWD